MLLLWSPHSSLTKESVSRVMVPAATNPSFLFFCCTKCSKWAPCTSSNRSSLKREARRRAEAVANQQQTKARQKGTHFLVHKYPGRKIQGAEKSMRSFRWNNWNDAVHGGSNLPQTGWHSGYAFLPMKEQVSYLALLKDILLETKDIYLIEKVSCCQKNLPSPIMPE